MRYLFLSAFMLGALPTFAQLIEVPLRYNKTVAKAAQMQQNEPVVQRRTALTLPFIDDFSYNSVYPTPELWENNQAWVNRGMGIKPPTAGVATLDGLNAKGQPYRWFVLANGSLDTLRSRPINLGGFVGSDSLYLSFYYQPGGNGNAPETAEKMLLDFKNNVGTWVTQRTFTGQSGTVPAFKQVSIVISAAAFLHPNFQFRFRNIGDSRGFRDHWHIDYVKIAKNRTWNEPYFNDVAFFEPPVSPFLNYTAMPYSHFKAIRADSIMSPIVTFNVWNHFNVSTSPNLSIVADEQYSNTVILPQQTPFLQPITRGKDTTITRTVAISNYDFSGITSSTTDTALLRVRYLFTNTTGQNNVTNQTNFTLQNDTITRLIPLRNYFAYDDGSAESSLTTQTIGTRAAIKFRTLRTDTLQGIQLHVPAFDDNVQGQLFDFEVYLNNLNGTPIFTQTGLHPYYGDSLQYWTSYSFVDAGNPYPPQIPINTDFYIVWRQSSAGLAVPIGLDKNTPANAQFLYQNTGTGWAPVSTTLRGALMMRPYMGSKRFINTEPQAKNTAASFHIQPNPANDVLNITSDIDNINMYNYIIINTLGQNIQTSELANSINISTLPQGIYFLQFQDKGSQNKSSQDKGGAIARPKAIRFVKL